MSMAQIGSVVMALGAVLLLIAIAAFFLRKLRSGPALAGLAASWGMPGQTLSCRVGRGTTLSIVTLGGHRFAVLNGPRTDQFQLIPSSEPGSPAP
ncbi:MAG TPA: hypothetical protein PLV07_01330 [Acidiphilium sp.]|jgi:hypothetical protein|uniref:hypothetical protein n=1 Tax=unclassified Acidiphilium TaxID=2617493 RepID=UPI000BC58795|nr:MULTISPECIES: hypothetical protein [unclassified Acidiphilium]OYV57103.1 MAG: hypothetical protein B7Z76_03100 [Acidiphilium sp. 20-67-58]HQT60715.1 hypothetical protein [Acidiphilium sp.]HQU10195.1 hypothetical protein [Acidiphilium sp.]